MKKAITIMAVLLLVVTPLFASEAFATKECVKDQNEEMSEVRPGENSDNGSDDAMTPDRKQDRPYGTV